eukprot:1351781-Prymnesium_polylepis.2
MLKSCRYTLTYHGVYITCGFATHGADQHQRKGRTGRRAACARACAAVAFEVARRACVVGGAGSRATCVV